MALLGSVTAHINEEEGGQEDVTCKLPLSLCPAPSQLLSTSQKAAYIWLKRDILNVCVAINKLFDFYGKMKAHHQNNGPNQSRETSGHILHTFCGWSKYKRWGVRT